MPSAYQSLGKSLGGAIESGYKARTESIKREVASRDYAYKRQRRASLFDIMYQALGVGSSLYEIYNQNQTTLDYAYDKGYKTTSNWLDNMFGSPKFTKEGTEYSAAEVMSRKLLDVDKDEFSRKAIDEANLDDFDFRTKWDRIQIGEMV